MPQRIYVIYIIGVCLSACASASLPPNFVYETSLRMEQGFIGGANRKASAETLLSGGVIMDPQISLQAALPDAEVKIRRWGLVYFSKNWKRYKAVLEADVLQDGRKIKCRLSAPDRHEDAPSLQDMRAHDGAELQRLLSELVSACAAQANL